MFSVNTKLDVIELLRFGEKNRLVKLNLPKYQKLFNGQQIRFYNNHHPKIETIRNIKDLRIYKSFKSLFKYEGNEMLKEVTECVLRNWDKVKEENEYLLIELEPIPKYPILNSLL